MTNKKDANNEADKDSSNNPVDVERAQVIRDIMDFAGCSEADAEEMWERFLETARKQKDK